MGTLLAATINAIDTAVAVKAGVAVVFLVWAVVCAIAIGRVRSGQELIRWTERRPVPWGLIDVIICFIMLLIFETAALQMLGLPMEAAKLVDLAPQQQAQALLLMSAGRLGAMVMGLLVLMVRHARPDDTGFVGGQVASDIRIGAGAFVMIAPPVYLLQNTLSKLWPEAEHPLVDIVRASPTPMLFGAAFVTAVVAAPVVEEFLLRGLFQGWLEKMGVWQGGVRELLIGGTNDWRPRNHEWKDTRMDRGLEQPKPPLWPVFVSSLVFAMMHVQPDQPSPDPIALFLFALGLGFVYQRTHRLLPCIVMHVLLNSSSMAILAFSIWYEQL